MSTVFSGALKGSVKLCLVHIFFIYFLKNKTSIQLITGLQILRYAGTAQAAAPQSSPLPPILSFPSFPQSLGHTESHIFLYVSQTWEYFPFIVEGCSQKVFYSLLINICLLLHYPIFLLFLSNVHIENQKVGIVVSDLIIAVKSVQHQEENMSVFHSVSNKIQCLHWEAKSVFAEERQKLIVS